MQRQLVSPGSAASCYFRSSVEPPFRKALIQITERCNLFCVHCFVSAGNYGDVMPHSAIVEVALPRLLQARIRSITLTGGEPFMHPNLTEIVRSLRGADIRVGICTNATLITKEHIEAFSRLGEIHVNVSLDGFRPKSHGAFRGDEASFAITVRTIRTLGEAHLLQGILVTPNDCAAVDEYCELCNFACEQGAKYVLMNPLASMGRGVKSIGKLRARNKFMETVREQTVVYQDRIDIVPIRFPNTTLPLAPCEAGTIIYVFTRGDVTVCPYLVFAARTPQSQHKPTEFIVGNIFNDGDIALRLDNYRFHERYRVGRNSTCECCSMNANCGKGCPAAVIATGERIGSLDREVCPIGTSEQNGVGIS